MSQERLKKIFKKTDGYCHICHKKLCFSNYNIFGARGAWEKEHSKPKAKGGTDHLNNLYPACISCNRSKKDSSTKTARLKNSVTRAPYSKEKKESIRNKNILTAAALGATVGAVFGPLGSTIGGTIGGIVGYKTSPKK